MQLAVVREICAFLGGCSAPAHRIQHIPAPQTPQSDQDKPPAPDSLTVAGFAGFNEITLGLSNMDAIDIAEVYASITNVRGDAVRVAEGKLSQFQHPINSARVYFYWARTVKTNAQGVESFSDWFPSSATAGVSAGSADAVTDLAPDKQFALATDQTHWYITTNGGSTPTLSLTGGNVAGKATFSADSNQKSIVSRRRPAKQVVSREVWTITMRWRRTSTISGANAALVASLVRHANDPSAGSWVDAGTYSQVGGILLIANPTAAIVEEINSTTVNVWQETVANSIVRLDLGTGVGAYPLLSLTGLINSLMTSGGIEIDFLSAVPGEAPSGHSRTYTATAQLSTSDLMNAVVYDSASGGTLTIPNGAHLVEGAKIKFVQAGAGLLTVSAASGTLFSPPNTTGNRALSGRYAQAVAEARGGNWYLSGSLA